MRSGFHHVRVEMLAHEGGIAVAETPVGSSSASLASRPAILDAGTIGLRVRRAATPFPERFRAIRSAAAPQPDA